MAHAADRMPSQRAPREERKQEAAETELAQMVKRLKDELTEANRKWASSVKATRDAQKTIDTLKAERRAEVTKEKIGKLKVGSTNFYDHVGELYKFLKRFDAADIAPLIIATLRKLGREINVDMHSASPEK
jgi:chromosome segregation ATPase